MRYIFIHHALPDEMVRALSVYGRCIPLPPFSRLPHPVSAHPDMLLINVDGTLMVHREYTEGQEILRENGIPYVLSHTAVEKEYPCDVRLNGFRWGSFFFAHKTGISEDLRYLAEKKSLCFVPVRQGYAKCATAVAGDAIATADVTIERAAKAVGIPTLLLRPHPIGIEVYDTGFIGGACVAVEDQLFFFGRIEAHPQYEDLRDFFAKQNVTLVSLSEKPLFDYGGAVVFEI